MAGPFREGLARVALNGKWGHINKSSRFVSQPRFDMAYEFSEGLATVEIDKHQGYVNTSGDLVVPTKYLRAATFTDGLAAVDIGTGAAHKTIAEACESGFINRLGELVIEPRFLSVSRFQHGLCHVETGKYIGYIDKSGEFVWKNGWVDVGILDPMHLLPLERSNYIGSSVN